MKIKLYLITYKNDFELNKTLLSLQKSDIHNYDYQITIVNNYHIQPVILDPEFTLRHKIINNQTRPAFSTGHIARNWNECLMDAFVDVYIPETDIAVLCQNDVDFLPDTFSNLERFHGQYSFITNGAGDALHSYTIDAVRAVGLWDERFCNIGYQESDYFLRQKLYNPHSSINDPVHDNRMHNQIDVQLIDPNRAWGHCRGDEAHVSSLKYHIISANVFIQKWGIDAATAVCWNADNKMLLPQYIQYPYFETDLLDSARKNYAN